MLIKREGPKDIIKRQLVFISQEKSKMEKKGFFSINT